MGAFVWVVNIVTPEKVCVDGAIVKIQSMPSACSVFINVYVIFAIVLLLLLEVGKTSHNALCHDV